MYDSSLGLINNYIIPYFGSIRLHELSPRMVAWMYGDLLGQQRYNGKFHKHPGERLSPRTLKSVHKLLHSVFEQAVLWEYVPSNPFQRAILSKTKSAPRPFLAPEQIHMLLANCPVTGASYCRTALFWSGSTRRLPPAVCRRQLSTACGTAVPA